MQTNLGTYAFYKFEVGHNAAEANKSIYVKNQCSKVKKFRSSCKNHDDQARSGRPKTIDFVTVFQSIDKSSELDISKLNVLTHLDNLDKGI